jgi:glutathione S-transferase
MNIRFRHWPSACRRPKFAALKGEAMTGHLWIGNRNYSSWSLRAWLCLRWAGVEFKETRIELDQPGYGERRITQVLAVSPSGQVPALKVGDTTIWDSLAIAEWAAESARGQALVPADTLARAEMRSVVAEMHCGFSALRQELPMNLGRRCRAQGLSEAARANVARIGSLWAGLRQRHAAGDFLFGARSIADAYYLPVATRFRTYAVALSPSAQAYCETLLADADFKAWQRNARADADKAFTRASIDTLYPGTDY